MYSYGPPTHGRAKAGRPARTYIQQLCEDTGCCPEDLPRAMNDREEWRERVRDIRAISARYDDDDDDMNTFTRIHGRTMYDAVKIRSCNILIVKVTTVVGCIEVVGVLIGCALFLSVT